MKISLGTIVLLIAIQVNLSCKKETSCEGCKENNKTPTAIAGPHQVITLPTDSVLLDGSSSNDPDGTISEWLWKKISGPASLNIFNASTARTVVKNLVLGVYYFELKVTDAEGLFSKDTVRITVNDQATNTLPCDSNSSHWTKFQYLPADEFFFEPNYWLGGGNFLMGIDNKVYAVSSKGRTWQYNAASDTWQLEGNFPENMSSVPLTFSVIGSGYCIGDGHCWQYDPVLEHWTMKSSPMATLYAPLVINNKVYMRDTSNHIIEYDPIFDHYSTKGSCPVELPLLGWFVINGNGFYVFENGQCWKYDAGNDSWQQKASLNLAGVFSNTTSFSLNSSGYIIGDLNGQAYSGPEPMIVVRYNSSSNTWSSCSTTSYHGDGRSQISSVSFNGVVFVGLGFNAVDFNATDFWKFQ